MSNREVVVVSAARTAIGTFGGSLKDTPTTELGALVVREVLARAAVPGADVGHVVFGHVGTGHGSARQHLAHHQGAEFGGGGVFEAAAKGCLLYTSPSPRD